jgi:hypothetical protein
LRLEPGFRSALYAAFAALLVTGAAWLLADQMKESPTAGEAWQLVAAYLLMLHGTGAMATLMLLGALVPLHIRGGWHRRRNRLTGALMVSANFLLIATSLGLYYAGSELLRPWMSSIHVAFGLCLPALFVAHVLVGRRSA